MLGISYGGFLTTRALLDLHPALKAASPQATCADMFIGVDFHHNGAFRLDYAFSWIGTMERGFGRSDVFGRYDHYDQFLDLGPLSNINKNIFHGQAPSWNAFDQHPSSCWRRRYSGRATGTASRSRKPSFPGRSRHTRSACGRGITPSRPVIASWFRSRAAGSPDRPQSPDLCAQHLRGNAG
jgi:predicted acyl esterase